MKRKAFLELQDRFEAELMDEILKDENIDHRIMTYENTYWGIIMGEGAVMTAEPFAKLYVDDCDREKAEAILQQVRDSVVLEEEQDDSFPEK